ncbi:glycosyltransferase family 4 protein [Chryseobacterium sp. PBS4-4]|uniref:Glycosyltransferase family 4 protein n=1 Tax=Chryseobacterium edaphi TaxID=2976532 RepID=A0ABT2W824_9FLAO|nr:glycosyltransferase family 1 protein [Chryseobacterium edaphi]MCU7618346.1 glycosyltransferase family 4 protein [Chryseobacterium edaphi]
MKTKLIFDIEIIGKTYRINETGIFRVAYELFNRLVSDQKIDISYSTTDVKNCKDTSSKIDFFFDDHNITSPIFAINCERVKFIPFRKEKPFRIFYNKIGIYDYKIDYNNDVLQSAQIYHSVYNPLPKGLDKFPHIKKVITIHDLIPLLLPDLHFTSNLLKKIVSSIGKDGYAICVSENTKKDLLNYAPYINPDHVYVSLLAASKELFYVCNDEEKFNSIKEKYNLPAKYFLSVGTLEPRKNVDHVIRTFLKVVKENNIDDLGLVLVGAKGWDYDRIFHEYDNAQELKDKIIITGRVPDEDLASLYSHANSFYYMSLYEGFGLPPLEAMQCGVATVTSNTSSLPEVVGDAGIMLDPKDVESLSQTMLTLYKDDHLRTVYSQKGLERSKMFSWEKSADEIVEIYQKICNS